MIFIYNYMITIVVTMVVTIATLNGQSNISICMMGKDRGRYYAMSNIYPRYLKTFRCVNNHNSINSNNKAFKQLPKK